MTIGRMATRLLHVLRFLSRWLFWPGALLIAWGELTPSPPDLEAVIGWDKLQHFVAYFGLASMAVMALGRRSRMAWAVLGVILFGGALEILQGFTGRDAELLDFVANSLGAFAGAATALALLRFARPLVGAKGAD